MAIERFTITSTQDIVNLVDSLGWFDNVELSDGICEGLITGISGVVFEAVFDNTFAFYTKGKTYSTAYESLGLRNVSYCRVHYAYKTKNGILFFGVPAPVANENLYYSCLVGKTQNGAIAFVGATNSAASATTFRSAAVNDTFRSEDGYHGFQLKGAYGSYSTGLIPKSTQINSVPIPTFPNSGVSYIKGALGFVMAPFTQAGIVEIDGIKYATNGVLALNDED